MELTAKAYVVAEETKFSDSITIHGTFLNYKEAKLCQLEKAVERSSKTHKEITVLSNEGTDSLMIGESIINVITKSVRIE